MLQILNGNNSSKLALILMHFNCHIIFGESCGNSHKLYLNFVALSLLFLSQYTWFMFLHKILSHLLTLSIAAQACFTVARSFCYQHLQQFESPGRIFFSHTSHKPKCIVEEISHHIHRFSAEISRNAMFLSHYLIKRIS